MSISIGTDLFPREKMVEISQDLTININNSYTSKKYKGGGNNKNYKGKKIYFFNLIKEPDNSSYVKIPFFYGHRLTNYSYYRRNLPNINIRMKIKWREGQKSIYQDVMKQLMTYKTSNLTVMCATGKTAIGAAATFSLKKVTLVLVHIKTLSGQWINTFNKFTNAKVFLVPDKKGSNKIDYDADVYICINTRYKYLPKYVLDRIGFVIVDEAHRFCSKNYIGALLCCNPMYILIETATREREDGATEILDLYVGSHCVSRDVKIDFDLYRVDTNVSTNIKATQWVNMIKEIHLNPQRINIVCDLVENSEDYHKIMIVCYFKEAVLLTIEELNNRGISCDRLFGNDKSYNDAKVLVSTINKAGTGFDQASFTDNPNVEKINMLILCTSNRARIPIVQVLGRSLRGVRPSVYMIVDDNNTIEKHWKETVKIAKEMGATVKRL